MDLENDRFAPPDSMVATIEEVMYRYVAGTTPPYGRLQRFVRYGNTPSGTWPTAGWVTVAEQLTSFSFQYQDASGNALAGSPLTAAQRDQIARIVINIEGIDTVGPISGAHGITRTLKMRGEALVRNRSL